MRKYLRLDKDEYYPLQLEHQYGRHKNFKRLGERDGYHCQQCGVDQALEVDHVIPLALGGTNDFANLQLLCRSCNTRKRGFLPFSVWTEYGWRRCGESWREKRLETFRNP